MMKYIHYSKHPKLKVLIGAMSGSGIRGAEDERVRATADKRLKRRVYFYAPVENGKWPRPEAGLGHFAYSAELPNLYDARGGSKDDMKISMRKNMYVSQGEDPANAYERAILDAGYDGYRTDNLAVVLNRDVPVKYEGTSIGKEFGNHTFDTKEKSRSVFTSAPNAQGEVSSSMLSPEQVMVWIQNNQELKAAAPSVKFQFGRLTVNQSDLPALRKVLDTIPGNFLT